MIVKILAISEINELFSVKLVQHKVWMDRRLTYQNLKKKTKLNQLDYKSAADILWEPWLVYSNIETAQAYQRTDVQ